MPRTTKPNQAPCGRRGGRGIENAPWLRGLPSAGTTSAWSTSLPELAKAAPRNAVVEVAAAGDAVMEVAVVGDGAALTG
jgi:hypothetical protein